jgi:hypothetical protein
MRSINLLRVAADAETLRVRSMLARQGRRVALGVVALLFGLGVLVLAEVAGWQALRFRLAAIAATLALLGANLLIAAVFGVLAARSSPGHTECEALHLRRQALDAARGAISLAAIVPIGRTLMQHWRNNGRRRRLPTGRS